MPGAAPLGARIVRVLEGRSERLDALGLRLVSATSHLGERRRDLLALALLEQQRRAHDDFAGTQVRASVGEPELAGGAPRQALRRRASSTHSSTRPSSPP